MKDERPTLKEACEKMNKAINGLNSAMTETFKDSSDNLYEEYNRAFPNHLRTNIFNLPTICPDELDTIEAEGLICKHDNPEDCLECVICWTKNGFPHLDHTISYFNNGLIHNVSSDYINDMYTLEDEIMPIAIL